MTDDNIKSTISTEVPLRDQLVNAAVNFLLNPDVQKRHDHSKIQFLKKKGLTEAEITAAFERARLDSKFINSFGTSHQANEIYPVPLPSYYVVPSIWSRLSDISSPIIVLGVALYGLHHLYQNYIKPWFLGKDANDSLVDHIKSLTKNIANLTDNVNKLHESITKQNEDINKLLQLEGSSYAPTPVILEDLRKEVNALKSILISRHQFPAAPQLQATKPTIPTWQLLTHDSPSDSQEQEKTDTYDDKNASKENIENETVNLTMTIGASSEASEEIKTAAVIQALSGDAVNGVSKSEKSKITMENEQIRSEDMHDESLDAEFRSNLISPRYDRSEWWTLIAPKRRDSVRNTRDSTEVERIDGKKGWGGLIRGKREFVAEASGKKRWGGIRGKRNIEDTGRSDHQTRLKDIIRQYIAAHESRRLET